MKKFKISILTISAISILIIVLAALLITSPWQPKMAYTDLTHVYNEFKLKKELEEKLTNIQLIRQNILDSLGLEVKRLTRLVETPQTDQQLIQQYRETLNHKLEEYNYKEQKFYQENELITNQYTEQIWSQINQYVKEFGIENNYKLIFGAKASGSVLYGDVRSNITEEVLYFINKRYDGTN